MASELGNDLDGAWWPRRSSVADELPELTDALYPRLGRITNISVNWSSLAGSHHLDSLYRPRLADPRQTISPQRLMTVTGDKAQAKLMVIPSGTSAALALLVLRRAADHPVTDAGQNSEALLIADHIVRAARAESARCARRLVEPDSDILAPKVP